MNHHMQSFPRISTSIFTTGLRDVIKSPPPKICRAFVNRMRNGMLPDPQSIQWKPVAVTCVRCKKNGAVKAGFYAQLTAWGGNKRKKAKGGMQIGGQRKRGCDSAALLVTTSRALAASFCCRTLDRKSQHRWADVYRMEEKWQWGIEKRALRFREGGFEKRFKLLSVLFWLMGISPQGQFMYSSKEHWEHDVWLIHHSDSNFTD